MREPVMYCTQVIKENPATLAPIDIMRLWIGVPFGYITETLIQK